MNGMRDGQIRAFMALVRKLGGEVTLTAKDLDDVENMELQQYEPEDFSGVIKYRVRIAPVTIQGDVVTVQGEVEA